MRKILYIHIVILGIMLILFSCNTKKSAEKAEQQLEEITSFISQDKLGNIYQISDMKIVKYSNTIDTIQTNSIFSRGVISSLDTRNPLQLMLFYNQQQQIVLLDNTLSETNKIPLVFFEWIDLACLSNRDNSFWLYTKSSQSLIKTNKQGKVISRFGNIGQLVNQEINPIQLIEYQNQVYLFDLKNGLFVFDLFGNYVKRIELKNAEKIKFYRKKVLFQTKNSIFSYDLVNFDKNLIFKSEVNFDDFEIINSKIILLKGSQLSQADFSD